MATIIVTGSNGQVGQELQFLAKQFPSFHFLFEDSKGLDITNEKTVADFFQKHRVDYCINCAAYTAVDKAESDRKKAFDVNVNGAKNLATMCNSHHVKLIQLSTDYIYHNQQNTPFKETDKTQPQSVYAETKLKGEVLAQKINPNTMVIRTSWVYSSFGHNFVKTMLKLGKERDELRIIFDQIGTPTYARELANTMLLIIQKTESKEISAEQFNAIYHYSNEGVCSWYDFAKAIFDIEQIECKVYPIETKDYPTPAKRPPFSLLNKQKIKETFEIEIPYWRDSLEECLKSLVIVKK